MDMLLIEECEDLSEICKEICTEENMFYEMEFLKDSISNFPEYKDMIVHLFKFYMALMTRMTGSPAKCLENFPEESAFSTIRLSTLSYILWKKIVDYKKLSYNNEIQYAAEMFERNLKNMETQTTETYLTNCESCEITKGFIREMVQIIDKQAIKFNIPSEVRKLRQELRPKLQEVTDWCTMRGLSEAILTDIEFLLLRAKRNERGMKDSESKQKLKEVIKNLEIQLGYGAQTETGAEIQRLNTLIVSLKQDLESSQGDINLLQQKLLFTEKRNEDLLQELHSLQETSQKQCVTTCELEEKIVEKMKEIGQLISKYEEKINDCNKTIIDIKLDNSNKQKLIDSQLISLEQLERQFKKCTMKENKMKEKINILNKKLISMEKYKSENEDLQKQLQEKVEQEKNNFQKIKDLQKEAKIANELKENINAKFPQKQKPTGNTEIDLKMQKSANEQKIELLKTKNKRLGETLRKINESSKSKEISKCEINIINNKYHSP